MDADEVVIEITTVTVEEIPAVSYKGLTGGWSKWGGARAAALKEDIGDHWNCQSCGVVSPRRLTPYLYDFGYGEYLRVCAPCFANGCKRLKQRLNQPED